MNELSVRKLTGRSPTRKHQNRRRRLASAQQSPAHIKATLAGDGSVTFSLTSPLQQTPGGPLVFNKTNNGMKKIDYYLVNFDFQDQTGLNLTFNPNPMKALWVAMGDALSAPPCPTAASYCDDVYAISVDPSCTKMTVRNNDPKLQHFTFSIGFVGDPEGSEYRFDPGGTNQDGGSA